jgi:hypothetical protein
MSMQHKERLDHHDRMIEQLGTRIEGVESGLSSLTIEMQRGFKGLNDGRGEVLQKLGELSGRQGPGTFENLKILAIGGSIVGMLTTAIFFLVSSASAPELTRVKTEHARVESSVVKREAEERAELQDLRRQQRERVESTIESLKTAIEDLKARASWQTVVRK